MDTDYLSHQAYGIIQYAASFDDTLESILGASCSECKDEDEYLKNVMEIIEEIEEEPSEYLEEWGLEEQFSVAQYRKHLGNLKIEVNKVIKMLKDKKTIEEW
jgi:hypothetical protein